MRTRYVLLSLIALCGTSYAGEVTIRTIALSLHGAPNLGTVRMTSLGDARINDAGKVLFWSRLTGTNVTVDNDAALWSDRSGAIDLVLREGSTYSNQTQYRFASLEGAAFNPIGLTAIGGAYLGGTNSQTRLATAVEQAFGTFVSFAADDPGSVVLSSIRASASVSLGIDGVTSIAAPQSKGNAISRSRAQTLIDANTAVPDFPARPTGAQFRRFDAPVQTVAGRTVFRAMVGEDTVTSHWIPVICELNQGLLNVIVAKGMAVPNSPGVSFADFSTQIEAASNVTAFWTKLIGAPVGADTAITSILNTTISKVVQSGDPAPGATNCTFASFQQRIALGGRDEVMFAAFLAGSGATADRNSGIWMRRSPSQPLLMIAREGDAVPGVANAQFGTFGAPLGNRGRWAFTATMRGSDVTPRSSFGLFATDPMGQVTLVVRTGQAVTVDQGPARTVRHISFESGSNESGQSAINSSGTLVFRLVFTDTTEGLFTADISCPIDFNQDGGIDGQDIQAFFQAWESGDASGDINRDGGVDGSDIADFFSRWEAGAC